MTVFYEFSMVNGMWTDGSLPHGGSLAVIIEQTASPVIKASDNTCTGVNGAGSGSGVNTYITCCDSQDTQITFSCITVWSGRIYNQTSYSIQCPNSGDYFMSSCSSWYV